MFKEITVQRISAGSLFKLAGLGLLLTLVPFTMLMGGVGRVRGLYAQLERGAAHRRGRTYRFAVPRPVHRSSVHYAAGHLHGAGPVAVLAFPSHHHPGKGARHRAQRLTIRPSRRRFAARLNSGVRPRKAVRWWHRRAWSARHSGALRFGCSTLARCKFAPSIPSSVGQTVLRCVPRRRALRSVAS
jgi:hypothetical protein